MTKICSVGDCEKNLLARSYCKSHYRRFMKYGDPLYVVSWDKKPAAYGYRVCNTCEGEKLLDEFPKSSRSSEGRARRCKECSNSYTAEWAKANSDRTKVARRISKVRSQYGEDGVFQYQRILKGEGCDACGEHKNRMAIDHNHKSGRVRGILCPQCNTSLGLLGEDPDRFTGLMTYLFTHETDLPTSKYSSELDETDLELIATIVGELND